MKNLVMRGMGPPHRKQQDLLDQIFKPNSDTVKQLDVCCGRGWGKTLFAIDLARRLLCHDPNMIVLFLEPDMARINKVFLKKWKRHVPSEFYTINKGERCITWENGAMLFYAPRNITGSKEAADDSQLGQDVCVIIDDEAALKCSFGMYANNFATIREPSDVRGYITLSTPRIGDYQRLIESDGHTVIKGGSADNPYRVKNYIRGLVRNMSKDQVRRDVFGEFVSLEGKIWKEVKLNEAWPKGSRNDIHSKFDQHKPWWLLSDLGSASGAYVIVQKMDAVKNGREVFRGDVWVAVADLCPLQDASASRAFQLLQKHFGTPVAISAGRDVDRRSDADGATVAGIAGKIWPDIRILSCDESIYSKQLQFDEMSYLVCSAFGERRLTVARDFVSLDTESHRGVKEMFDTDQYAEESKRREGELLPKDKSNRVQHCRDALLMGTVEIMSRPDWRHDKRHVAA